MVIPGLILDVQSLDRYPVKGRGVIVRLEGSMATVKRLTAAGLLEGEVVELRRRTPLPVLRVGFHEVAMEPRLLTAIFVSPLPVEEE